MAQRIGDNLDPVSSDEGHFVFRILEQLGTLLTAGAVVGLFGKLLGASDAKITVLSLFAVVSLYIWIYRGQIRDRLDSALVTFIIVLASTLAVLFHKPLSTVISSPTLRRVTGIVEYSPRANDFLPRLSEYVEGAEEEIWFTGISFYISLPSHREALLRKLKEGVNVRFLVYNPLSPNFNEVASGFNQTTGELLPECQSTIEHLRGLLKESSGSLGKLEVKLFSNVPKMRIYVFDRRRSDGYTYFIPHVDSQNSPNVPGFLATNLETGVAPAFIEGINRVWDSAMEFDQFLSEYDKATKQPKS